MKSKIYIKLLAVEKITFLYILITFIFISYLKSQNHPVGNLLSARIIISIVILTLAYINSVLDLKIINFLRIAFIGFLLTYWYPETFEFNRYFNNYDYLLASWEQNLFGFQPALVLKEIFYDSFLSELMYMSYMSFFVLIFLTGIYFYFKNYKFFEFYFFSIIFSFAVFYLIFILFPTSGPQYYFKAINGEDINTGIFPLIGSYFNSHTFELKRDLNSGFFQHLYEFTHHVSERPTGAFPSSHIGISTLIMILLFRKSHTNLGAFLLPLHFFLVLSTVYIRAHYVVDVYAGFILSFILYRLSSTVYQLLTKRI